MDRLALEGRLLVLQTVYTLHCLIASPDHVLWSIEREIRSLKRRR